jgi:hypothetical protein
MVQGLAELEAGAHVLAGNLQYPLHATQGFGNLGQYEPIPRLLQHRDHIRPPQQIGVGDAHLIQHNVSRKRVIQQAIGI